MMPQSKQRLALVSLACVASCSGSSERRQTEGADLARYREAIASTFRNPRSAEFRDERVRILWSKGGNRLQLYCGEVSADNAFGGKTGFKDVTFVIEAKDVRRPSRIGPFQPGKSFVDDMGPSLTYYVQCIRSDTERRDNDVFTIPFGPDGAEERADIDRQVPMISDQRAPELGAGG
jgi:hypothetical protein